MSTWRRRQRQEVEKGQVGDGWTRLHVAVDPGQDAAHFGVNSRLVGLGAALAPAGEARQVPAVPTLTHQRPTAVALTGSTHTHTR